MHFTKIDKWISKPLFWKKKNKKCRKNKLYLVDSVSYRAKFCRANFSSLNKKFVILHKMWFCWWAKLCRATFSSGKTIHTAKFSSPLSHNNLSNKVATSEILSFFHWTSSLSFSFSLEWQIQVSVLLRYKSSLLCLAYSKPRQGIVDISATVLAAKGCYSII